MQPNGQTYFGLESEIPDEDRECFEQAVIREDQARLQLEIERLERERDRTRMLMEGTLHPRA